MDYKEIAFEKDTLFLVTGGAGFIGSNLCEAILEMGYRVRCFDNFSIGRREKIIHLQNNSLFEEIDGDIRDYDMCISICQNADFVLHHAAYGSPSITEMPSLYDEINVKGTINMMEAARNQKVKKFVYASSSSVYGDDEMPQKKEEKIGTPLSLYALTKRINEDYGKFYAMLYGLETYGLRCFNVFGRGQNPDAGASLIAKFIKLLQNNEPPIIYGDGSQSRDFVYIRDVVTANLQACKAPGKAAGQVYNIASGEMKSVMEVYNYICKVLGKNIKPILYDERNGDIKHSWADISKAKVLLGYNPEWDFEKGIDETIKWYKQNLI